MKHNAIAPKLHKRGLTAAAPSTYGGSIEGGGNGRRVLLPCRKLLRVLLLVSYYSRSALLNYLRPNHFPPRM